MTTSLGCYALAALDPGEEEDVRRHLTRCHRCADAYADLAALVAMLHRLLPADGRGDRLGGRPVNLLMRRRRTDAAARRAFRRYWLLIRPFSGLIRRDWLRAVAARAENQPLPGAGHPPRSTFRSSLRAEIPSLANTFRRW